MNQDYEMSVVGGEASKRSLILELSQMKDIIQKEIGGKTRKNNMFKRVCCIKINRKWSIKRQILVTTSVVFVVVLSIVTAFIGVSN